MQQTQYGRLTFIERTLGTYYGRQPVLTANWKCQCSCGTVVVLPANNVLSGRSTSCGCYRKEWAKNKATTHGKVGTPEYRIWSAIKRRCHNSNCKDFSDYGARGITVCSRWFYFENFLADMGPRPSTKHSIDRINNSLGYFADNCRWATQKDQQNNRRTNRRFEHDGVSLTISQWADIAKIDQRLMRYHLVLKGRSVGETLRHFKS